MCHLKCKDVIQSPKFGLCCQRIICCNDCINRWFEDHSTCPHCATPGTVSDYKDVRGLDGLLVVLQSANCDKTSATNQPA